MIQAVTFDFWETIVHAIDYTNARIRFLIELFKREGILKEWNEIKDAYKLSQQVFYDAWKDEQQYISAADRTDVILRKLNITLPEKLKRTIIKEFEEIVLHAPPPLVAGADEVLASLRDYKIGLICDSSMTPGRILRKVLHHHRIRDYFQCTVFSDEVGCTKPNPRIFRIALEQLHVQPHETIHVGDLLPTDIIGAKAVGMKAVWFSHEPPDFVKSDRANPEVRKNKSRVKPDFMIKELKQLLDILSSFL